MSAIERSIKAVYENLKEHGADPVYIYVPQNLAGKVEAAVKSLGVPLDVIKVAPYTPRRMKSPRCTYRTIKRGCAKRNR